MNDGSQTTEEYNPDRSVLDGRNVGVKDLIARHDGNRSIRARDGAGEIGLATATYSYQLNHAERVEIARRIAVLWNLHLGVSTEVLEAVLAKKAAS